MSDLGSADGSAAFVPEGDAGGTSSPGWPRRWQPWQALAALVVVVAVFAGTLVAIRSSSTPQRVSTGPSATTAPATITPSTTTTAWHHNSRKHDDAEQRRE